MEEWGSYMSAKKAKLDEQFHTHDPKTNSTKIFEGIKIYINGYTNPPEPELREIFTAHGGQYSLYLDAGTTFVIATNLPATKKRQLSCKTLKPEWITDSVAAGAKLDCRKYFLYDSNQEQNQKTLTQFVDRTSLPNQAKLVSDSGISNDKVVVESVASPMPFVAEEPTEHSGSKVCQDKTEVAKATGLKSTTEDGFLEEFYNNSRLHLISTMKKHTQELVASWRRNSNHEFTLLHRYLDVTEQDTPRDTLEEKQPTILHIDIDCFFVAVGRLTRPHLLDLPVAVTHSKGTKSGSKAEIACVSYEGRAKGISAGMWLDEAKRLCPELQTIPYEFEEYKRVSTTFFETVASLTLEIEPISCDELYLNATKISADSGAPPRHLSEFLRNVIKKFAKVVCSIGIGNSKLSARIATRQAKESGIGICQLTETELREHIIAMPVQKLPGVGWSTAEKLQELYKVETCNQLQRLTLHELKQSFGDKTGDKLYWLSRGVDNDHVQCDNMSYQAKSISAGCSFGVRFTNSVEVNTFVQQLSAEVSKRATESKCFGKKITLSLWVVKKGYIDAQVKPGGHGIVDIHSRTRPFHIPTRNPNVISKMACELVRSITKTTITPNYIRGVRISLDNLRYESEMTAAEKKSVQRTIDSSFATLETSMTSDNAGLSAQSSSKSIFFPQCASVEVKDKQEVTSEDGTECVEDKIHQETLLELVDCRPPVICDENIHRQKTTVLNGVRSLSEVKRFLKPAPSTSKHQEYAEMLGDFLTELLEANRLNEGRELIFHIWGLVREFHTEQDENNLAWALILLQILRASEDIICTKYEDQLSQKDLGT